MRLHYENRLMCVSEYNGVVCEMFQLALETSNRFCCRCVSESGTMTNSDKGIPRKTMVPDYGVAPRSISFFFRCFFSCEKSHIVTFQNFAVLGFVKRLCRPFTSFHVKNICTWTSGCKLKNGAPTHVLRKIHTVTEFGEREN